MTLNEIYDVFLFQPFPCNMKDNEQIKNMHGLINVIFCDLILRLKPLISFIFDCTDLKCLDKETYFLDIVLKVFHILHVVKLL